MIKYDLDKINSKERKILDFLFQVENLYVFKVNVHLVQIEFTDNGKTSEDCLTNV